MNLKNIQTRIQQQLEEKENPAPNTAYGVVLSQPGSEEVILDTTSIQFMECDSNTPIPKHRYCVVEKGVGAKYAGQFVNSRGDRTHIITREVFNLMLGLTNNMGRQVRALQSQVDVLTTKVETYEMLINGLRKNGIID